MPSNLSRDQFGNCRRSATSVAFLRQLRARHSEPLTVIWDKRLVKGSHAHRGDALRDYPATPALNLCWVW